MQARNSVQRWGGLTVLGTVLVLVGLGWFVLRELLIDPFEAIADAGWPFFVIIPGVVMLIASLVRTPPHGVGLAIAGSIVTTVGAVLFYQQATGNWESRAYAWALVGPGAAGLGMAVYGQLTRTSELVDKGVGLVVIAGVLYIVGWWYFEGLFSTGEQPVDIGTWWPVVMIGAGAVIAIRALFAARRGSAQPTASDTEGGATP